MANGTSSIPRGRRLRTRKGLEKHLDGRESFGQIPRPDYWINALKCFDFTTSRCHQHRVRLAESFCPSQTVGTPAAFAESQSGRCPRERGVCGGYATKSPFHFACQCGRCFERSGLSAEGDLEWAVISTTLNHDHEFDRSLFLA